MVTFNLYKVARNIDILVKTPSFSDDSRWIGTQIYNFNDYAEAILGHRTNNKQIDENFSGKSMPQCTIL
jgi:hypothetical protein